MDNPFPPDQDPDLQKLVKLSDGTMAPAAPMTREAVVAEQQELCDMIVKAAATVARFDTGWMSRTVNLSMDLTRELLSVVCQEGLVEELWQSGGGNAQYRIAQQGRDLSVRLMESCGYIGPAPIRLESYAAFLRYQFEFGPVVKPEYVTKSLSQMVIPAKSAQLAGLAVSSGRSLFVFGPAGNGKSTLGRCICNALPGDYWVPYCVSVSGTVIRVYDAQAHKKADMSKADLEKTDQRWVRIKRPLVVVGGELTLDMLDVVYSPSFRFYEAPPHLKANGGVFLVDDFGRERVSPEQLLNRFITPMEHQVDYFTLRTGQKIMLPLRHVLIFATNLSPELVTDPAFLRRMGYRLHMASPTPEQYRRIFHEYAARQGATVIPAVLENIMARYQEQGRQLRGCEPRDIIERAKDICKFHNRPLELSQKVIDIAWTGYFGEGTMLVNKREQQEDKTAKAAEQEMEEATAS